MTRVSSHILGGRAGGRPWLPARPGLLGPGDSRAVCRTIVSSGGRNDVP